MTSPDSTVLEDIVSTDSTPDVVEQPSVDAVLPTRTAHPSHPLVKEASAQAAATRATTESILSLVSMERLAARTFSGGTLLVVARRLANGMLVKFKLVRIDGDTPTVILAGNAKSAHNVWAAWRQLSALRGDTFDTIVRALHPCASLEDFTGQVEAASTQMLRTWIERGGFSARTRRT